MIKMTFDATKAIKRFDKIKNNFVNPEPVMKILAVESWKGVLDNFNKSTGRKGPWKTWSRLVNGKRIYYSSRPTTRGGNKLLLDTGLLRNSIQNRAVKNNAYVYTINEYANYHEQAKGKYKSIPKRDFLFLNKDWIKKIKKLFQYYTFRK